MSSRKYTPFHAAVDTVGHQRGLTPVGVAMTKAVSPDGLLEIKYPKRLGLPDGDFKTHLLYAVVTNEPSVGVRQQHKQFMENDAEYRERYENAVRGIRLDNIRSKRK